MSRCVDRIPCDCRSKSSHPNVVIEASLRRPKDHQNDPSWEPQIHFKVDPEISAWNMCGMWMEYVWNTYGICMEYAWNTDGACMEYAWTMYGIWIEYVWNMHGICMEYVWKMYGMCMQLAYPVLSFTCLGPTLMPMVCRLCVVSAPKKRGSVLASSCGGEHAGNVHGMCMESAWNIPSMCTEVHGIAAECDGVWTENVWNTASH